MTTRLKLPIILWMVKMRKEVAEDKEWESLMEEIFKKFSRWLLELGNGTLTADIQSQLRDIIEIPEPIIVKRVICKHYMWRWSHVILSRKCLSKEWRSVTNVTSPNICSLHWPSAACWSCDLITPAACWSCDLVTPYNMITVIVGIPYHKICTSMLAWSDMWILSRVFGLASGSESIDSGCPRLCISWWIRNNFIHLSIFVKFRRHSRNFFTCAFWNGFV